MEAKMAKHVGAKEARNRFSELIGSVRFGKEEVNGQMRLFRAQQRTFSHLSGPEKKKTGFWHAVLQGSFKHARYITVQIDNLSIKMPVGKNAGR